MGYRGEDGSRTPAAWGEQPPRRPAAGSAADMHGYDQYPPPDGYAGYGQEAGYGQPGYDEYGTAGHSGGYQHDGYRQEAEYGDTAGYGETAGYGDTAGYGETAGSGYGGTGGYDQGDGYRQDTGYQQGYGYQHGDGYRPDGGSGRSGGWPALPGALPDSGSATPPGGFSGNDWYEGQPAAASGSGFADTGTYALNSRMIEEYGTAARQAFRDPARGFPPAPALPAAAAAPPQPLSAPPASPQTVPHTGQQERYEDDYDRYFGRGRDDQAGQGYGTAHGYAPSPGPDDYAGYGERPGRANPGPGPGPNPGPGFGYAADDGADGYPQDGYPQDGYPGDGYPPAGYPEDGQHRDDYAPGDYPQDDYGLPGADSGPGGYGDYPESGGYDDQYPGNDPRPRDRADRFAGRSGRSPGGKENKGGNRNRRPVLLAAVGVAAIAAIGFAADKLWFSPSSSAAASTASQPLPTSGPSASTPACVAQFGTYCHIELRTEDPAPLTLSEVFLPEFQNNTDHAGFTLAATKLDKTCSDAVIGQNLTSALAKGKCTQVLRASYVSADGKIMGTIGVVNLATTNEAHYAGKVVGQSDFVKPLTASKGKASKLGQGTGLVEAEFKGHYLILTWAEFVNGTKPTTKALQGQLQRWEADLVAGTANISLSQRMVNGSPAKPGG